MKTFLFYDIETTGLNKAFDQVLQFAAIRTDVNLNELKRYELKIKLNPDVIPSPGALITHEISVKNTLDGVTEYEAVKQIHQWLNEPGTISLGYNSLNFDDEFLRFCFYRNLLPPYTHQYANQCNRMDIFPITVMYFLYKSTVLKWPKRENKISLKLADLNAENQFCRGRSHDAMVDVETTLALTKCLMQERDMWEYLQSYFNKQQDLDRINQTKDTTCILIDSSFGFDKRYQSPVSFLGFHRHYKNQSVWLCLDSIEEDIKTKNKKIGEPGFLIPFREKYWQHLDTERMTRSEQTLSYYKNHPDKLQKLAEHYTDFTFPIYPETDADARLYLDGFPSPVEERLCQQFHAASLKEKSALLDKFQNPILATRALRILGRNFPEILSPTQRDLFQAYLHKIYSSASIIDYQGKSRLTPQAALNEISSLLQNSSNASHSSLLKELEVHLKFHCTP